MSNVTTIQMKNELTSFARANYAAEIEAYIVSQEMNIGSMFAEINNPDLDRAAAEINVSRAHSPEAWKQIDEIEHAAMIAANGAR